MTLTSVPASSATEARRVSAARDVPRMRELSAGSATARRSRRFSSTSLRALDDNGLALMARELDDQLRATVRAVVRMDLSAEILDDAVGDREAEPQPLANRLGGEERIEHAFDLVVRNAVAVVGDADGN